MPKKKPKKSSQKKLKKSFPLIEWVQTKPPKSALEAYISANYAYYTGSLEEKALKVITWSAGYIQNQRDVISAQNDKIQALVGGEYRNGFRDALTTIKRVVDQEIVRLS
jgi:hypothetical protein